jgi:hypothetical protein
MDVYFKYLCKLKYNYLKSCKITLRYIITIKRGRTYYINNYYDGDVPKKLWKSITRT